MSRACDFFCVRTILQTAQVSLLHAQKMATLGQLTAGIAHEIKNPFNFVNNFGGLSAELLDELREATAPAIATLDPDKRAEIDETIEMLTGNLGKIVEHSRRIDGIVKSMPAHSRGASGDWQAVDLNALVEEALNLAYHGARAQDQSFNIAVDRDLDPNLAPIEVVPQDLTRVFLNLFGNGFYAAHKRSRAGDGAFRPILKVTTRDFGEAVEIGVRDNGTGIAKEHREKLFQPFFTTKPTGEGTGLGLSISYEIVTQQHRGTITVDSELGQFTEFTVRLPRRQHPAAGRTGSTSASWRSTTRRVSPTRSASISAVTQGQYVRHFARPGKDALGLLAKGVEPQLIVILSDINRPGIDGLRLLRELKDRRPDLPVIMVRAHGDEERTSSPNRSISTPWKRDCSNCRRR